MAPTCSAPDSAVDGLAEATADGRYCARVTEVVQRIATAQNEAAALELLREATHRMGADVAAFISFVHDDPSHESYRFLLACDPSYCAEYEQQSWYADDPWLAYALRRTEPACACDIEAVTPQQRAVVELAALHGFRSALIVPAPSAGGLSRVGVLCIGSWCAGFFDSDGFPTFKVLARALSMELHDWWIAHVAQELIARARIAPDDLVLLRHERCGHRTKQIALALGKSPAAIDSQFQRLNARLGVPNRKAAAALAAEYGLV
jgi:hypothetical protein